MTKTEKALTIQYKELLSRDLSAGYGWKVKEVKKTRSCYLDLSIDNCLIASTIIHPREADISSVIFILNFAHNHNNASWKEYAQSIRTP